MWLSEDDVQLCAKFVFDMEYIGNIEDGLDKCHPWEIAVQCVDTDQKFYCAMWPQLPAEEINGAFAATEEFNTSLLHTVGAKSPCQCFRLLGKWIESNLAASRKCTALLISHNCFASDMPILTRHMHMAGASFSCPVLFFDSLLFCRYAFRGVQSNFTLDALFEACREDSKARQKYAPHRAIGDTRKLHTVLCHRYNMMSGIACYPGSMPLTLVPGIGTSTARVMMQRGIEDLQLLKHMCIYIHGELTVESCENVLRNTGVDFSTGVNNLATSIVGLLTNAH